MEQDAGVISVDTLWPEQNGCYFADNISKCILMNEKMFVVNWNFTKFVPKAIWQVSFDLSNGLVLFQHQATAWINGDQGLWCQMASPNHN